MKYVLLAILGWVSCFVIFAGAGVTFEIASGMYNKDDIYLAIEGGALIATALVIVGTVLLIAAPIASKILAGM